MLQGRVGGLVGGEIDENWLAHCGPHSPIQTHIRFKFFLMAPIGPLLGVLYHHGTEGAVASVQRSRPRAFVPVIFLYGPVN